MKNRKVNKIKMKLFGLLVVSTSLVACQQSAPPDPSVNTETFGRVGDSIHFAGHDWTVKIHETGKWGPGPNYFSGNERDITIDDNGYLHMKIVKRNDKWFSTEVVSDKNMGFGTYIFTVDADLENISDNIVLGLFTWDNNTFQTDGNSEVDIEVSKWNNKAEQRTLQYGVQPIFFGQLNEERKHRPEYPFGSLKGVSTHAFTWTEKEITWVSYAGDTYGQGTVLGEWSFDDTQPARVKQEGGNTSEPIVIPKPGSETNARINLWLVNDGGQGPETGRDVEIIIRDFQYIPL